MNTASVVLIIAQTLSNIRGHHVAPAVSVEPIAQQDAGHGHEPASWVETDHPTTPAVMQPAPAEHAPWWVYATLIALVASVMGAPWLTRRRSRPTRLTLLQGGEKKPAADTSSVPRSTAEYVAYLGTETGDPTRDGTEARTPEQCQAIYIDGVEGLVKRMVWPERMHCTMLEEAPVETRWRAWLGDQGWDRSVVRSYGRTQGMALKGLLRSYRQHGGAWIAHALERSCQ